MSSTMCKFHNSKPVKINKFYECVFSYYIICLNNHENSSFGKLLFDLQYVFLQMHRYATVVSPFCWDSVVSMIIKEQRN